ncbi:unnamed protein product [Heligmosomoides polygyrus]|uniref:Transthyretin-like family protein n=1 Tax=Heligmosomoides polygyrus TaxID=6339 RepID=A0A183FUI7_HELPZ|nr:unnamed protein product [Heligmosomoides polygyrus]
MTEVNSRVSAAWSKWSSVTGVLCDRKIPEQCTALNVCWPATKEVETGLSVVETKMLRWTAGVSRMDRIRNDVIRRFGVAPIADRMREARLRWYGHVLHGGEDSVRKIGLKLEMWIVWMVVGIVAVGANCKMQRITVRGVAMCNREKVKGAKVELWERDPLNPDDLLNTDTTSRRGEFEVKGEQDEIGPIEPYLLITHSCSVKKRGCKRESEYPIPKSKIDGVYDMTFVNLNVLAQKDKEKC